MPIEIQPERPRNIEGNGDFELKSAVSWMNQIVLPRIQIDAFFDLSTLYQSVPTHHVTIPGPAFAEHRSCHRVLALASMQAHM